MPYKCLLEFDSEDSKSLFLSECSHDLQHKGKKEEVANNHEDSKDNNLKQDMQDYYFPDFSCKLSFNTNVSTEDVENFCLKNESEDKDEIRYSVDYEKVIDNDYKREENLSGLTYINEKVLKIHGESGAYLIKKVTSTLLKGDSIMNISLPVFIFDERSLLEV